MNPLKRTRGEQAEGLVQVLILLVIGSMAAAASFTHVHNVAAAHGQPGWLAWADAVVLELMSIATGLEIRRRHRGGRTAGFVLWILIGAVALSLSAQVVEAERSVIGWLAAALPAAGFLALVKIVLTRTPPMPIAVNVDGTSANPVGNVPSYARPIAAEWLVTAGGPGNRTEAESQLRTETDSIPAVDRRITADSRPGTVPVPPGSFTRTNGVTIHSGEAK